MKIDINLSIFKKSYAWSIISCLGFITMFIMWMGGTKLTNITIFCMFAGAIFGNFNAAMADYRADKKNKETSLIEIIKEIRDDED